MPTPTSVLRAQLGLDVEGSGGQGAWDDLRGFIRTMIEEHIDLSPGSAPSSHQKAAVDEVIRLIRLTEPDYFPSEDSANVKFLKIYLTKQINNLRHGRRQESGVDTRSQWTGRRSRPTRTVGVGPGSHRESHAPVQVKIEEDLEMVLSNEETTHPDQRLPDTSSLSSPPTSRLPPCDLGPSDPRLGTPTPPEESVISTGQIHRHTTTNQESENQLPIPRPPRDPELMDFLSSNCGRPLSHLYPALRMYGCRNMRDLRMISKWPLPLIMRMTKRIEILAHQDRMLGDHRGIMNTERDVLTAAIKSLGERASTT